MARVREAGLEERILDSAFAVFGDRGFQATTIKEIAIGAGISSGSIYTYFPDKEALFRAAVTRGWESFIEELEAIGSGSLDRQARVSALLDRGFLALGGALPIIRGMFFDASRLNLIEANLDRVCRAIDRLMAPDRARGLDAGWEESRPRRLLITRILILGVLASAALVTKGSGLDMAERLREATASLLAQAGIGAAE
jgi:AcrR family transcriptional regulator